jgi:hypothetical protein
MEIPSTITVSLSQSETETKRLRNLIIDFNVDIDPAITANLF